LDQILSFQRVSCVLTRLNSASCLYQRGSTSAWRRASPVPASSPNRWSWQ
jgi:hypothetical protein